MIIGERATMIERMEKGKRKMEKVIFRSISNYFFRLEVSKIYRSDFKMKF